MSGLEITLLLIGLVFIGGTFTVLEMLINKKQRNEQRHNDDMFLDLMTKYDSDGYGPTIYFDENGLCTNSEQNPAARDADAKHFKDQLIKTYFRRGR